MFLASFSILFMTFFMLRDSSIIKEKIHNILSNYLTNVDEKMDSIVFYLKRYFSGLGLQLLILFSCYAIGLKIFNIEYALAIAFFAAIINIIPYVGPIIGFSFAAIIISSHTGIDLLPGITFKTFILFSIIQTADNFIFQPLIFC